METAPVDPEFTAKLRNLSVSAFVGNLNHLYTFRGKYTVYVRFDGRT
jgi:hypothetical protein